MPWFSQKGQVQGPASPVVQVGAIPPSIARFKSLHTHHKTKPASELHYMSLPDIKQALKFPKNNQCINLQSNSRHLEDEAGYVVRSLKQKASLWWMLSQGS